MTQEVEKEILDLYFERLYTYDQMIEHFKGKYTYTEIKRVINKRFEDYGKSQQRIRQLFKSN